MRRSATLLGAILFSAVFCASQAGAVVMETWTQFSVQFTNLGRAGASATATGLATVTTSSSTSSHLSTLSIGVPPALSVNAAIPVTDPNSFPITSVQLQNVGLRPDLQGGVFGNISGALANSNLGILPNTVPETGGATICLLIAPAPPCGVQLNLVVGATSAGAQIGGGVGGILTIGGTGTIRISIVNAPYTVKTVSAVNRTNNGNLDLFQENGFAHGPASVTSSTAQASGVFQAVTAQHITIVAPGPSDLSGIMTRVLTHFVPEPSLVLLFGSGAIGMALLGRRRMKK